MASAAKAALVTGALAGLTAPEVERLLARHGPNVLPRPRRPSAALALARQATHFFALMLWVAAGLAWLAGMPQLALAIVVVVVVVVNAVFAYAQEHRADRAAERLRDLMPQTATGAGSSFRQPTSCRGTWFCWRPVIGSAPICGRCRRPGSRSTSRC